VLKSDQTFSDTSASTVDVSGKAGGRDGVLDNADLPPWASCTLAATTLTTISRPRVSVTMNRFRPLIFFPAS
jgi:hypothetical protein